MPGVREVSHAAKARKVLRRLGRPASQAPPQIVPHQKAGAQVPRAHAKRDSRKKSPRLGTVAQICEAWREAHSASTDKIVAALFGQLCGPITPHQITPLHLEVLVGKWKTRLKPGGLYNYVNALRRLVVNIATSTGQPDLIHQVPRVRRPQPRQTIATPDELEKLLTKAPAWLRTILLLAAHAGLRRSDCMRVAPIHYSAEAKTITIQQTKTKNVVSLPVTETLAALLESAPTGMPTTPFYELHRGEPISTSGLEHAFNQLKRRTGVNHDLWIHDLRRTLAVSLYETSKDLRVVEQMLGHQSLASTTAYLEHRDPSKLKPWLDALFIPKGARIQ